MSQPHFERGRPVSQQSPPEAPKQRPVHRNPWETEKAVSVFLAVFYHGISSMSPSAIPPRISTVLETAQKIEDHLRKP